MFVFQPHIAVDNKCLDPADSSDIVGNKCVCDLADSSDIVDNKYVCDLADSSDIVDNKLKLIMGLIWTLILHYSISMPMWEGEDPANKDQTPKQRLLAWIQSKIPEKKITNFTTDWNDGTAIAALVDALAPGTMGVIRRVASELKAFPRLIF